jgi:hypothetical protein
MSVTKITDDNIDSMNAAKLTGVLPAMDGSALTNLPAGGAANATELNDYETGTWTPGFMDGGPSYGTTYQRHGTYVKVGDLVTINWTIYMGVLSFSNGGAILKIGPLPFVSLLDGNRGWYGNINTWNTGGWDGSTYNNGSLAVSYISAEIPHGNTDYINVRAHDKTSASYHIRCAAIHGGSQIGGTHTYRTN